MCLKMNAPIHLLVIYRKVGWKMMHSTSFHINLKFAREKSYVQHSKIKSILYCTVMEITDRRIDGQCDTFKRNVFTHRHSYNTLRTSSL